MWYKETIGEVPVYWLLMSRGGDNLYGVVAQEGTIYSGTMLKSLHTRIKSGPVLAKPPDIKVDDTEDKKKTVEKIFRDWGK